MALNQPIMDVSSWDGTLSANDFYIAARAFADRWKMFNSVYPPWSWIPCRKQPLIASHRVEGYLSLDKICLFTSTKEYHDEGSHITEEGNSCSNNEEIVDNATLVESHQVEAHYYDFHIVYSASYMVPVLYLRGYSGDGQPLLLDEIEKDLPTCSARVLLESKWTFITQEEHPYLSRPWYKLHPCGTIVGQVIGLSIPFDMLNDKHR